MVITRSDAAAPYAWSREKPQPALADFLRLPFHYQTEAGEVVIGASVGADGVAPRIAQVLVELVIDQTTHHYHAQLSQQEHQGKKATFRERAVTIPPRYDSVTCITKC